MRILHLVSYSLFSGPLPPTLGLALAQRAAGDEVFLAFDRQRGNFDGFEEAAAPYVEGHGLAPPLPLLLCNRAAPWWHWRDLRHLNQLCQQGAIDVVHAHLSHDHLLAALLPQHRTVLVRTVHAPRSLRPRWGQRLLWARTAGAIVRSGQDLRLLQAQWPHPLQRLGLIPAGIDAAQYQGSPEARSLWRQRLGIPAAATLIGQAALLHRRGQEELLEAVARLGQSQVHILFAGLGEMLPALRRQAQALGLGARTHFAGYLPHPELAGFYAALDLAFVGRLGNDAGGRAALEPMAAGVPLLACAEGAAVAELAAEDRAWLVPSLDPSSLAAALSELLADRPAALARAQAAQHHVQFERSLAREAAATRRFYNIVQALKGGHRPQEDRGHLGAAASPGLRPAAG